MAATAEIAAKLGLREWVSVSSGFDRPNLARSPSARTRPSCSRGARGVLRVRLTGQLDGRPAYAAIKSAKDSGWESYRAIERFIANAEECRRRQILEHFGDSQEQAREGRCCSVCDPDPELAIHSP